MISPGPLTTIQDAGRTAFQHMGVPVSGALDRYALHVANCLVGNRAECAVLEATLAGARIEVLAEADIALTGAASALTTFFESPFTVSARANRMGYRLEGPVLLREPDAPAIILLNEQTLGGYAKIATVINPDLFKVAQAKPGDTVRFAPVTVAEAGAIARQWATFLSEIQALLAG